MTLRTATRRALLYPAAATVILDIPIIDQNDDVEEEISTGAVDLASSDLELGTEYVVDTQIVGLRFANVPVPQGQNILLAYLQFTVDEPSSMAVNLEIAGEAADDAGAFLNVNSNVSNRNKTAATVEWSPPAWENVSDRGAAQRTPDIKAVIQEIVNRPGWTENSALALFVSPLSEMDTGKRVAVSFSGSNPDEAAVLHIEY